MTVPLKAVPPMKIALLTREFPPEVYGGAGVHVEHLAEHLDVVEGIEVAVHAFGAPRSSPLVAGAYQPWDALAADTPHAAALGTISVDLAMAAGVEGVDLVHSHTWYANLGGHLAKLIHGVPHVATCHSLEPLRPWKAEQLGGGYAVSSWCERTGLGSADAIIAVSAGMAADVVAAYPELDPGRVHVVHNGVDTDQYRPDPEVDHLVAHGVDPERPYLLFVGRVTRQKGIIHLLDAVAHLDHDVQVVLAAGQPDTPELGAELRARVAELQHQRDASSGAKTPKMVGSRHREPLGERRGGIIWIEDMLAREAVVQLMSHAAVFVCPSIYEPFGLINVEAMACEAPVVASAVGGIPEIVVDGETGWLVPFEPGDDPYGTPADPGRFAVDLAARIDSLLADPATARSMGQAGRRRVLAEFAWPEIATRTATLYRSLL